MNTVEVKIVRIYITEASGQLKIIIKYLQEEAKIRGISIFRAISGFGETGEHSSFLLDLSLNLPLVVEFFDEPKKINNILDHFSAFIKPEHIIFWTAQANQ